MVWAGSPFAHLVEFSTGAPTGAVSYQVRDGANTVVHSGSVTPLTGDVSTLLVVDAAYNTCALPLFENRVLSWSYLTATGAVSDRVAYRVDEPLPFVVTAKDVRDLLGVAAHELSDDAIDLVAGYAELLDLIPDLAAVANAGDRTTILATKAIAAATALDLLPSMQLRAAQTEKSGDDTFARFAKVDWVWLGLTLRMHVDRAREALDGAFDGTGERYVLFTTAPRSPDAITGEA